MFSFNYKYLILLLLMPLLFLNSCKKDETDDIDVDNSMDNQEIVYDYISLTLNDVEYNGLTPMSQFSNTITPVYENPDTALALIAKHSNFRLTLEIPYSMWSVGTYNIEDILDFPSYDVIEGDLYIPGDSFSSITSGTLTITEFNTVDKVINGTFELTYDKDNTDGDFLGVGKITNGTINNPLDSSYFN